MKKRLGLLAGILVLLIVLGVAGFYIYKAKHPFVPDVIRKQLASFTVFVPADKAIVGDPKTVKYDGKLKAMSFTAKYAGSGLIFTEQATPSQFVDIPNVYPKLVAGLGQYAHFGNDFGDVYLVKSRKVANKQVAIMNAKGTLMFIKANNNLTQEQWQALYGHLKILTVKWLQLYCCLLKMLVFR